ncbi:MAG: patatin-like phospholipase family protein [Candidatus Omnitrophota bacterium]|nr:patatin-like phospholipase family protein [Candidatus Omnitrophota bacterium]
MDTQQTKFIIANTPPFNKLKDQELVEFLNISEVKEYKNGAILYRDGDQPDYFYFILQGRVVALTTQAQSEQEIELLKRGTSFGIISLFNDEPHSVTTRSIENSFVLRVEKDKFKDFLNKHPLISFEFYRLLSQRIRGRARPKKIFQCKRIGIFGVSLSGKTTYMFKLGSHLNEQTQKKVICVELSINNNFTFPSLMAKSVKSLDLDEFKEENIDKYILRDKVDYLLATIRIKSNFLSLLNFLSENYHFILYEIPSQLFGDSSNEVIAPSDYLHFLVSSDKKELIQAASLIKDLKSQDKASEDKIKVILNEFNKKDDITFGQVVTILNQPIYATLPSYESGNYTRTLRRIARQIGEGVLGLALGSGGAYGFSHVGVLKILEKNNVNIDIICGSSIGAMIAALWALGYRVEEIEKSIVELGKKMNLFSIWGFSFPFRGFLKAKYLENILKKIFKDKTFYDLKRTLKIVVFDFTNKETRILEDGLLYKAVAASCAMPGIFEPIRVKNEILFDGGILSPLPTKVLLNYGVHKIIAVNITPSREEVYGEYRRRNKWHIFDFIFGSIETMQREFVQQAITISDTVIHPNFEGLGWLDFDKVEDFIKRGEEATLDKLEEIKKLA